MRECRKCATELLEGACFCHVCGERYGKSKKIIISIISLIAIGTMSMGGYWYYNSNSDRKVTSGEKRDVKPNNEEIKNEKNTISGNAVKKDLIMYTKLIESGANERESVAEDLKVYFVDANQDEAYKDVIAYIKLCNERKDFKSVALDVKVDAIKKADDKQYELTYSMTYKTNYTNGKAERVQTFRYKWLVIEQDNRLQFKSQKKQEKTYDNLEREEVNEKEDNVSSNSKNTIGRMAYNRDDVNIHARNIKADTGIVGYNQKIEISLTSNIKEGGSSSATAQSTIKTANIAIAVGNKLYRNPMVNAGSGTEALILSRELGEDKNIPSEDSYINYYFNIPSEVDVSGAEVVLLSDQGNIIGSSKVKGERENIADVKKEVEQKLNELGETNYVRVEVNSKNPSLHTYYVVTYSKKPTGIVTIDATPSNRIYNMETKELYYE
ncbi:hypothetical protein bcgnr5406_46020 [Bacillus cereus]|uniref:Uncharacterized protein n=2 Tax=Bacillaceae TaxID=186817 RepID=A0A164N528_BACCE|nr:hypothetical protein B4088_3534 [Bacillus cereus]